MRARAAARAGDTTDSCGNGARAGDGTITADELGNVMRSLGQNLSPAEVKEMVDTVDADGNGEVDFEEFLTMMAIKLKDGEVIDEIISAFKLFDGGNKGTISQEEVRMALASSGDAFPQHEIEELLDEAREHGFVQSNGHVDYASFARFMLGLDEEHRHSV